MWRKKISLEGERREIHIVSALLLGNGNRETEETLARLDSIMALHGSSNSMTNAALRLPLNRRALLLSPFPSRVRKGSEHAAPKRRIETFHRTHANGAKKLSREAAPACAGKLSVFINQNATPVTTYKPASGRCGRRTAEAALFNLQTRLVQASCSQTKTASIRTRTREIHADCVCVRMRTLVCFSNKIAAYELSYGTSRSHIKKFEPVTW